jgi:formylmethanofuran dehydrogenase subunit E
MNDSDVQSGADHQLPEDLRRCVSFHGHLCPGLVYGYLVAKEAMKTLRVSRSRDEEVVVISENDTCAVDALQWLLGTTIGKGNLILRDYGKNVFTVLNRSDKRALRFSRKSHYVYEGLHHEEFAKLEGAVSAGTATMEQRGHQRRLKVLDLLSKPFEAVFDTNEVTYPEPPYAPLAPSEACAHCGEMTMATKMIRADNGTRFCIPCAQDTGIDI